MTSLCLIFQSYTFMSRIFSLLHERAFQRILMRFIFVINVRNNEPPEQLGYRQKHPTTKPTSYTLWPIWFVAEMVVGDMVYLVADMHALWPIWYRPYIFVAKSIWVPVQIFEQFCPKAGDAEPETDFNAKWPFKVIQCHLGIIEEPLMGYIAQCNTCGFRCERSEDIASERSENRHFRPAHSHLTPPLQRTPGEYPHKTYLLETRIPGLHFCR